MNYVALLFRSKSSFGVTVPDIPGFTATDKTLDGVITMAKSGLAAHLAAMTDHGFDIPKPRSLDVLRRNRALKDDFTEAEAVIMLPALLPAGRSKPVTITIQESVLELIDEAAKARGVSRSAFLADAGLRTAIGDLAP